MSRNRVFVIGASGNVGKATINALSKNFGEKLDIKAGVRNPEKVPEFNSLQGVTVVRAEMGKRVELEKVFNSVDVLFIVVPPSDDRVELTRVTAEVAKESGVKHILSINVPNSPDSFVGKQFYEIERHIKSLGVPYTFLRLPWFMPNYFVYKENLQKASTFSELFSPSKRHPAIDMGDTGLAAAVIMSSPEKHTGKMYDMVSDRHSFHELAKAFTKVLGKDVSYTQRSYEAARADWLKLGIPEWNVDSVIEYAEAVNAGKYDEGNDSDFTTITGKKPTSVATWVQQNASAFK